MSQSSGLRVQAGKWKGRAIPIPAPIKGHSHFTPAIVKKSVFSILEGLQLDGSILFSESVFVDLFAGSGQMGVEALSRGFAKSVLVELTNERFGELVQLAKTLGENCVLHRKDSLRVDPKIFLKYDPKSVVVYIDPPYTFWTPDASKIKNYVESLLEKSSIPMYVLVQGPDKPIVEDWESREFGSSKLYILKNEMWNVL
ncbi:RsmD family RNA methyltransferase [Leptospira sp. GIMC2001]|uniref:RsmD family RNA methyltransferase n=1 Tax=Leptospira sp. GIMC2001 TaxID=1513297 RepID=UPI00234BD630|nr:RsmD family RNA methyltransferase [Leptospira sp. GIMC2001]WCL49134.1 RsmD family RNA methyltransferase [Leptospira sp. GIMC2001]